jgi:plasmid stabilization system protein ParE
MMFVSVLSDRAYRELLDAWEWYEEKQPGLGDRFKQQVYNSLNSIERSPLKGVKRMRSFREVPVKVFLYLIIYRIENKASQMYVDSIFHTSRDPGKKYSK